MTDASLPQRPLPPSYPQPPGRPEPAPTYAPPPALPPAVHNAVTVALPPPDVVTERLLDQRIVLLGGTLDDAAAERAVGQLLVLGAEDTRRAVTVHVACRGGSPAAALAVHDALRRTTPEVVTRAGGLVDALGVLLVAAGSPGHRFAAPHARLQLPRRAPGQGPGARPGSTDLSEYVARLVADYGRDLDPTGVDAEQWLTADQAVAHGVVDQIDG